MKEEIFELFVAICVNWWCGVCLVTEMLTETFTGIYLVRKVSYYHLRPQNVLFFVVISCTRIEQLFVQRHKSVDLAAVATF